MRIIIVPITAYKSACLAFSIFLGLPPAVKNMNAAQITTSAISGGATSTVKKLITAFNKSIALLGRFFPPRDGGFILIVPPLPGET